MTSHGAQAIIERNQMHSGQSGGFGFVVVVLISDYFHYISYYCIALLWPKDDSCIITNCVELLSREIVVSLQQ